MTRMFISTLWILLILSCYSIGLYCQDLSGIQNKDPLELSGQIYVASQFYRTSQTDLRQEPYSYSIAASPTFSFYGIRVPLRFTYTNRNINYQHPFNQYGLAPSYKWAKLLIGYNTVSYSKYVLHGLRIKGVGIELNPGLLRFGAFRGRLRKAVDYDVEEAGVGDYRYRSVPSYAQSGYGFKAGIGNAKNYIDLAYLNAKDDDMSILAPTDSLQQLLALEQNTSIGATTQLSLGKFAVWKTQIGISAYTNNQLADTVNLDISTIRNIVNPIYTPNQSSQFLYAWESDLRFKSKYFNPSISYTRIDPDYRTLGSYSRTSDLERIKLKASVQSKKRTFVLAAAIGLQKNDLAKVNSYQTRRLINSVNVNIRPNQKFSVNANYTNFGVTRDPRLNPLNDTIRYSSVSQNITITPVLILASETASHTASLNFNVNSIENDISLLETEQMRTISSGLNYNYAFTQTGSSLGASLTYLSANQGLGIRSLGYGIHGNRTIGERKISTGFNLSLYNTRNDISKLSNTLRASVNGTYNINAASSITSTWTWIRNSSTLQSLNSFRELIGALQFNYQFLKNEK